MEYLLDVFSSIHIPLSNTNSFIRSILYDSNSNIQNFIGNYGLALKNLSQMKSNNINLRFIRRRKQFIQIIRLEQARKQDDNLVFHLKYDGKTEISNILTLSGIHSISNTKKNELIIYLDEISPNDKTLISAITLNTNDNNTPSYLPLVIHNDITDKSELILFFSIDKPHL
ncbi:unnamed protein product, partial [Rotaria sordida]